MITEPEMHSVSDIGLEVTQKGMHALKTLLNSQLRGQLNGSATYSLAGAESHSLLAQYWRFSAIGVWFSGH